MNTTPTGRNDSMAADECYTYFKDLLTEKHVLVCSPATNTLPSKGQLRCFAY